MKDRNEKPRGGKAGRDSGNPAGRKKQGGRDEQKGSRGSRGGRGQSRGILRKDVLALFHEEPDHNFTYKQLMRKLKLSTREGRELLFEYLADLKHQNKIIASPDGTYSLNFEATEITGTVDLANARFAYVTSPTLEEDIRVYKHDLMFAMQGDKVRVRLLPYEREGRAVGEVIEILERQRNEIVGKIELSKNFAFVLPDSRKLYFDIFIPEEHIGGAKKGDKVIAEILKWPSKPDQSPLGKVTRVLGQAGEHHAEMHSIMAEFGLPFEFPEEVEAEAEAIPVEIPEAEIARRRDMREVTTFTIDPVDAKDFDDALSIQRLENGNWEIGVHIADVTHYVQPGSLVEEEGYNRATSVYLVDRTIPMLPEKLSNNLCSLRPHEDKLTFSAVFEVSDNAEIISEWFGRTVIHSNHRFAYEDAQVLIEAGPGGHVVDFPYLEEVNTLDRLAKILKDRRFKKGAISFETQEVRFKLDENGKPLHVYVKERKDAHKMIEEWMLLANRKVAEFVYNLKKGAPDKRLTMVYRTHAAPDPDKLTNFSLFARKFGYKLDFEKGSIPSQLNNLTEDIEGKPEQNVLQNLAIRTMAKAKYSTAPEGHFGLAFDHYSHFTSPIRRYPDMMAHRLLQHYLDGGPSVDREEYEERCIHSSEREKRAADGERASIKYKQVEFMQEHVGKVYKGIVSGVSDFGLYVEIEENKCEGMVRLADMEDDYYELDADNYRIIGRRSKRIISFGDEIMVEVKATNLSNRTIDLVLAE